MSAPHGIAWLGWMAWTGPTAAFFVAIALLLAFMTVLERRRPTTPRRGWLGFTTTRGDRLFVSLLAAAFIHAAWLGASDAPVWIGSAAAALLAGLVFWRG